MTKKSTCFRSILTLAFAASMSSSALADTAETPDYTLTGNLGLFSSYRFRGIDQTFGQPTLQGGFDYVNNNGFYAGNWNSNVNSGPGYPESNLEMDFYGGYKRSIYDFGIDVGAYYYYYPGSKLTIVNQGQSHSGSVDNKEIYVGGSWKFVSLKYFYSVGDYFSVPNSKGSHYLDLSTTYDLGEGWGINGHVGQLNFKNVANASYTDWKLGVTKDMASWVLGLAYVDTNAQGNCGSAQFYCFSNSLDSQNNQNGSRTKNAGRGIAVVSVSKTF